MFTGIIEEVGKISGIIAIPGGKRIKISASEIMSDIKIDDSISVSGICLTVIEINDNSFTVEAVGDTFRKTTIANLHINHYVNLERAMKLNDRLGGHLIQGHINDIGKVRQLYKRGDNWYLEISIAKELIAYVINEGSIAIDGISLTVAHLEDTNVGISVIPHTYKNTTISTYSKDQEVNIEVDYIARYLEKLMNKFNQQNKNEITFTREWFKDLGY
jgi:riboflavin synthase